MDARDGSCAGWSSAKNRALASCAHGCAPRAGERKPNPELASTFRRLAAHGAKKGFYTGPVAEAIVEAVRSRGGVLSLCSPRLTPRQQCEAGVRR